MISGVKLAAPVLVMTDRGEVEAKAGDYLAVMDDGRQVVMSEAEYRAATGAAESPDPGIPEAEVSPAPAPVKKKPNFLYSLVNRKRAVTPAPAHVLEDPLAEEEVLSEPEVVVRPPPPSQEGRSLASLESLVIPKRREGSFRSFMRPGPAPVKATKKAKRPMVLPFQKKKAKVAKVAEEPGKERYRYVRPEWI